MDTKTNSGANGEVGPVINLVGFILLFALWITIVLGWREFVGHDGGVEWLVQRLFG